MVLRLWFQKTNAAHVSGKGMQTYHLGDTIGDGNSSLGPYFGVGVANTTLELTKQGKRRDGACHCLKGPVRFFTNKLLILRCFQQQLQQLQPTCIMHQLKLLNAFYETIDKRKCDILLTERNPTPCTKIGHMGKAVDPAVTILIRKS